MGRKEDLEKNIRGSYALILKYETIRRDTDRPEERQRAERIEDEQWVLMRNWLDEYIPLCQRLNVSICADIVEVAMHFPEYANLTSAAPPSSLVEEATSTTTVAPPAASLPPDDSTPSQDNSLEKIKDHLRRYLWGQLLLWLLFLLSVLEGLVGIFEVPPCPRRLMLISLTVLGGGAILGLSLLPRYRDHYQAWDRWLAFSLLVIAVGGLGWLTYQACIPANQCPTVTLSVSPEQITPGDRARLTAKADDPENDPLDYVWEATASGLQNEGGPYKRCLNEYVAPPGSAGEVVRVKVMVDDHHCGSEIEASTIIRIVLPSETSTPAATLTPTTTPTATPIATPPFTPTPTSSPTGTLSPTPTLTISPPTQTSTPTPTLTPTPTPDCRDVKVSYLELFPSTERTQIEYPDKNDAIDITIEDIDGLQNLSGEAVLTNTNLIDGCTCNWLRKVDDSWEPINSQIGSCSFLIEVPDPVMVMHLRLTVGGQTKLIVKIQE